MYEKYGGFDEVFRRYYRRVADEYILPVEEWCDGVLEKDEEHHVKPLRWQNKWAAHKASIRIEDTPVVVAGGGQAGMCTSFNLREQGVPHVVLERDEFGATWKHGRWDSFALVTENSLCAMPGFPTTEVGHPANGFMKRTEIAAYLTEFAARNSIVARKVSLVGVMRGWSGWVVKCANDTGTVWFRCAAVVMAVGAFHKPKLPPWADELPASVAKMHSSAYKRPSDLPTDGAVVVVGSAQSGSQIALELCETAKRKVYMCLSRGSFRLPRQVRGRDITWWLWKLGLYDTSVDMLTPEEVLKKRRSANPSQAPGRELRFRELAHKNGLVYVGRGVRVAHDENKLLLDSEVHIATLGWPCTALYVRVPSVAAVSRVLFFICSVTWWPRLHSPPCCPTGLPHGSPRLSRSSL